MKLNPNVGGIRLKLGGAVDAQPAAEIPHARTEADRVGARVLAKAIAASTVKVLLDGDMLDPVFAEAQLQNYAVTLEKDLELGQCILQFLFPDEGRLAMVIGWLNSKSNTHVWEMANRIPPPEAFYKAHPRILGACKLCGAVILDASTPATITTGSINPLIGDLLARWIQTELEYDPAEMRPRFFFNVEIPPRLWPAVMRSHFRYDHVL